RSGRLPWIEAALSQITRYCRDDETTPANRSLERPTIGTAGRRAVGPICWRAVGLAPPGIARVRAHRLLRLLDQPIVGRSKSYDFMGGCGRLSAPRPSP